MSARKDALGLPFFEILVALSLTALFATVLLDRIAYYGEQAEKTRVELTVRNMRSGLQSAQARALLHGLPPHARLTRSANPVQWLIAPPPDYRGEVDLIDWKRVSPGSWVYERRSRALYYFPRRGEYLRGPMQNGVTFLKFVLISRLKSSGISEDADIPIEVSLTAAPPYRWFD